MNTDRNLPAFPIRDDVDVCYSDYGMTLRDYFAAKAMASLLIPTDRDLSEKMEPPVNRSIAKQAYRIADAMLEARIVNTEVL